MLDSQPDKFEAGSMIIKPSPFLVSLLTSYFLSSLLPPGCSPVSPCFSMQDVWDSRRNISQEMRGKLGNVVLGLIPILLTEMWPLVMVSGVSGARHAGKCLVLQVYPEHSMLQSGQDPRCTQCTVCWKTASTKMHQAQSILGSGWDWDVSNVHNAGKCQTLGISCTQHTSRRTDQCRLRKECGEDTDLLRPFIRCASDRGRSRTRESQVPHHISAPWGPLPWLNFWAHSPLN